MAEKERFGQGFVCFSYGVILEKEENKKETGWKKEGSKVANKTLATPWKTWFQWNAVNGSFYSNKHLKEGR